MSLASRPWEWSVSHSDDVPFTMRRITAESPYFESVLALRRQAASPDAAITDEFDETADIYLMSAGDMPVVTMRVNQAHRGRLDCEEYYPQEFIARFRPLVGSASRFVRDPQHGPDVGLMRRFVHEVRRDQISSGILVDLINVHRPMVIYYSRLGYYLLCNSYFRHPRLGTPSYVMMLLADLRTKTSFEDVNAASTDPAFLDLIWNSVPVCGNRQCLRNPPEGHSVCLTNGINPARQSE